MKRKIALLIAVAVSSILFGPIIVRDSLAQSSGKVYRLGFLYYGKPRPQNAPPLDFKKIKGPLHAFVQRMAELGYVEGRNLVVELRGGEYRQLKPFALELVREKVDVIFTAGALPSRIVQDAVKTTPLVFYSCDPFEHVTQLAHPGGNVTGSTCMSSELIAKRLELLKELIPRASRVAYLSDPKETPTDWMRARDAASQLGVTLKPFSYEGREQVSNALKAVGIWRPDAIFVNPDAALVAERGQLANFALKQRLPAIYTFPVFAEAGGLISYGSSISEGFVGVAEQVAAILGGARPGDVPVRRATIFHLVINLKTAKALNIEIPQSLLIQADQVIQ